MLQFKKLFPHVVAIFASQFAVCLFALYTSAASASDIVTNYDFTVVNWGNMSGSTFTADGGTLSGTLSFDWTTNSVLSANILSLIHI